MQCPTDPGTGISRAQSSATSFHSGRPRAATAGNWASRSSVTVNGEESFVLGIDAAKASVVRVICVNSKHKQRQG